MTIRTLSRWAVVLVALLVPISCAEGDDTGSPDDQPGATAAGPATEGSPSDLCVRFPLRDAGAVFGAADDPGLAGDPEAIHQLLDIAATGLAESAPPSIRSPVEVYATALRQYQPGTDPLADPATSSAVRAINAWLADNCGPPTATAPPGTTG